jgi:ribosome biogenesis GTPase A
MTRRDAPPAAGAMAFCGGPLLAATAVRRGALLGRSPLLPAAASQALGATCRPGVHRLAASSGPPESGPRGGRRPRPARPPAQESRPSAPRHMRAAASAVPKDADRRVGAGRDRAPGAPRGALSSAGAVQPTIQWYPGHIAKAERRLRESLRLVDVVVEVRDCRVPLATAHPEVKNWVGNRPRVLAMNRADLVPEVARAAWREHLVAQGETPRFINAKEGRGVRELKRLALDVGSAVNEKRVRRGLLPRPVRCVVIGYPNVGKSALINRLVGKRAAKSSNKPGVTRNFQWVRISDTIELLDMPGVIPAKLVSQDTALRLAICDDIGQAAYDTQITAGLMVEEMKRVAQRFPGYVDLSILHERFKVDPALVTGEEFVHLAAGKLYNGDAERTACRLLKEFRSGDLGPVTLEAPQMATEPSVDVVTKRQANGVAA